MEKTETLFISTDKLLKYCGDPLGRENSAEIFSYASFAVKKLLKKISRPYGKLKLSVYEGLFSGSRSVIEITEKKFSGCSKARLDNLLNCTVLDEICKGKPVFFYPISDNEGKYRLLPPVRLSVKLEGSTEGFEKTAALLEKSAEGRRSYPVLELLLAAKRKSMLLKVGAAVMKKSVNELAFVTRFNEETFFRNVPIKSFAAENGKITRKELLTAFVSLYAIAFYGLSFREIFTVDEVFGFSDTGIRSKDEVKAEAAISLSEKIKNFETGTISADMIKMGEALLNIPLPEIEIENFVILAENYVFYSALSEIGEAYAAAALRIGEETLIKDKIFEAAVKRAELMKDYKYAARLCEEILTLTEKGMNGVARANSRKKAAELRKRTEKERNHGGKV